MRVLVTGASGLLGTWLLREAPRAIAVIAGVHTGQVVWPDVVRADLRDANATSDAVGSVAPDVVVHAAYLRDRASIVDASMNVARDAADVGARLLLVSTDAVFTGDGRPRCENDIPDPVWDYGRWKAEAEQAVVSCDPPCGDRPATPAGFARSARPDRGQGACGCDSQRAAGLAPGGTSPARERSRGRRGDLAAIAVGPLAKRRSLAPARPRAAAPKGTRGPRRFGPRAQRPRGDRPCTLTRRTSPRPPPDR
jgi:hypothetical protein